MSRFSNPKLFSQEFGVDPKKLDAEGLLDPFINVDLPLFIDPLLLSKSANPRISVGATEVFRTHFENFVKLLLNSNTKGDVAWRAARKLLDLKEPPENGLGFGSNSRSGSSRSETIRQTILQTSKEIVDLGVKDPDLVALMGFFEDGVGPDTISDFTTRVIQETLAEITQEFCKKNAVRTLPFWISGKEYSLPAICGKQKNRHILLVPVDIVRDLPIANDWSEIESAAMANNLVRERVNELLANVAKPTLKEKKRALRQASLSSAETFDHFLSSVRDKTSNYDPAEDALGYFRFRNLISSQAAHLITAYHFDPSKGPEEVRKVALEAIELFKKHVETGNLWEELWINGKPKRERSAQLIFFAIADVFCKLNDIDISPEANMGGGPVDFKFSRGYSAKVLVEIKRDTGSVRHGYETQLEHYKKAADTFYGIYVVMDYGRLGSALTEIQQIRNDRLAAGERASDIIVIDATPKRSASKK